MNCTRRAFHRTTLVAAMSVPSLLTHAADDPARERETLPIVDTHQHLWDLNRFRPPWLAGAPEVLKRSYVMQDYRAATAGLNVTQAVYMEVDVAPEQQVEEAEQLLAICRAGDSPTVGAVISGRPNSPDFRNYIEKYRSVPEIKGVRQVLHVPDAPAGLCLQPQFVRSIQFLGEIGKSFDLCMRPTELADAVRLVDQCPETRFIVDHCGNADPKAFVSEAVRGDEQPWHTVDAWQRSLADLAKRANVICKISGIVARVPASGWDAETLSPIINFCLDTFGPDRVVFGGDWPVCLLGASYRQWVEALRTVIASRPAADQRKLLSENAVRLYKLPTAGR